MTFETADSISGTPRYSITGVILTSPHSTIKESREGWVLLTIENWGEWGLKEYEWKGSFLGWFVGLVGPIQQIFVLPWLL